MYFSIMYVVTRNLACKMRCVCSQKARIRSYNNCYEVVPNALCICNSNSIPNNIHNYTWNGDYSYVGNVTRQSNVVASTMVMSCSDHMIRLIITWLVFL